MMFMGSSYIDETKNCVMWQLSRRKPLVQSERRLLQTACATPARHDPNDAASNKAITPDSDRSHLRCLARCKSGNNVEHSKVTNLFPYLQIDCSKLESTKLRQR